MFAGVEVLRFHGFLRVLNAPRNQAGLNRHTFRHTQAEHERLHALAAEDAHEVVFQGEKKPRGPRIALAARAAAQLVINAPRFMALRAKNVQAAKRNYFIMFRFTLPGKLIIDGLPLIRRHLKDFPFVLEQDHRRDGLRD